MLLTLAPTPLRAAGQPDPGHGNGHGNGAASSVSGSPEDSGPVIAATDTVGAQAPDGYQELLSAGTKAYNDEKYQEAVAKFAGAIQVAPWLPTPYRDLARSYFYLSDFPSAAYYYNLYLTSPSILRTEITDAEDVEKELTMALSHIDGEVIPLEQPNPETYKKQLAALEEAMANLTLDVAQDRDDFYIKPYGAYRALMRSNYASPELTVIHNKLANALAAYIWKKLKPPYGVPTPRMSFETLRGVAERLDELEEVAISPPQRAWAKRQRLVLSTMIAVASRDSEQALKFVDQAINENRNLNYLYWYKIAALYDSGRYSDALDLLRTAPIRRSMTDQKIPEAYFDTYRGAIEAMDKKASGAAASYWTALTEE